MRRRPESRWHILSPLRKLELMLMPDKEIAEGGTMEQSLDL